MCRRQLDIWNAFDNSVNCSNMDDITWNPFYIFSMCINSRKLLGKLVKVVYSKGFKKLRHLSFFYCICLFNWNYLTTYLITSIGSYLWWFVASCSRSCNWHLDWIKGANMQMETEDGLWNPSSMQPHCLSHFQHASLLPAAMGSSSLSLNQMSSGSRSYDEKFMESWTHYKFYSFTAEILQVLLTYWRQKYALFLLVFPNGLLVCTFFLQNVYVASSNVFYITLKSREALTEGNNSVLLPVEEGKKPCNWKRDQAYGSLINLSLWQQIPYVSQRLYPKLF